MLCNTGWQTCPLMQTAQRNLKMDKIPFLSRVQSSLCQWHFHYKPLPWLARGLVIVGSAKDCFKISLTLCNRAQSKRCSHVHTMTPQAATAVNLPCQASLSAAATAFGPPTKRKAVGAFHCCCLSLLCWQRPHVLVYIGRSQHSSGMNLALGTP